MEGNLTFQVHISDTEDKFAQQGPNRACDPPSASGRRAEVRKHQPWAQSYLGLPRDQHSCRHSWDHSSAPSPAVPAAGCCAQPQTGMEAHPWGTRAQISLLLVYSKYVQCSLKNSSPEQFTAAVQTEAERGGGHGLSALLTVLTHISLMCPPCRISPTPKALGTQIAHQAQGFFPFQHTYSVQKEEVSQHCHNSRSRNQVET